MHSSLGSSVARLGGSWRKMEKDANHLLLASIVDSKHIVNTGSVVIAWRAKPLGTLCHKPETVWGTDKSGSRFELTARRSTIFRSTCKTVSERVYILSTIEENRHSELCRHYIWEGVGGMWMGNCLHDILFPLPSLNKARKKKRLLSESVISFYISFTNKS